MKHSLTHVWCFYLPWLSKGSFYEITCTFGQRLVRREGSKACNLSAASCNLLHFKLELMPDTEHLTKIVMAVDQWEFSLSISLPNLLASSLQTFSRKLMLKSGIQLWILSIISAKVRDQSNSRHVSHFKFTNHYLASCWAVLGWYNVSADWQIDIFYVLMNFSLET